MKSLTLFTLGLLAGTLSSKLLWHSGSGCSLQALAACLDRLWMRQMRAQGPSRQIHACDKSTSGGNVAQEIIDRIARLRPGFGREICLKSYIEELQQIRESSLLAAGSPQTPLEDSQAQQSTGGKSASEASVTAGILIDKLSLLSGCADQEAAR
ncbi:MAG: hypothetical protein ACOYM3_19245 [Terrimicrobiaceae bacterium]